MNIHEIKPEEETHNLKIYLMIPLPRKIHKYTEEENKYIDIIINEYLWMFDWPCLLNQEYLFKSYFFYGKGSNQGDKKK